MAQPEHHDYDGITENREQRPPVYFTVLFYGLIIWGVAFCAFYLLSGWSSDAEFQAKMQAHEVQQQSAVAMPAAKPAAVVKPAEPAQPKAPEPAAAPTAAAARIILSEIGTDMSRFGSHSRLASWAGMCPGNKETAGKRKSGKTRKGNRYLRRVLAGCAWATQKTDSFLGRTFRRLHARIGGKKAAVAVGHKILVIVYHLLNEGTMYDDGRYNRPNPRQEARQLKRALSILETLGYQVQLSLAA